MADAKPKKKVKDQAYHGRESCGLGAKRSNRKSFKGAVQNNGTVKPVVG